MPPGFAVVEIPLLHRIPILGPALFSQTALGYFCFAVVGLLAVTLSRRTWAGLVVDAVGGGREGGRLERTAGAEDPLPVRARRGTDGGTGRRAARAVRGALVQRQHDRRNRVPRRRGGDRGQVARARRDLASVFFGIAQALQFALPALGVSVPFALLVMLPYVIAIVAVSGFIRNSRSPANLTVAFARAS